MRKETNPMKRIFFIFAAASIALAVQGCSPLQPPIVDHTGVDEAKYNQDLAWCYNNQPGVALGNPITKCMQDKGYKVLRGF
jgi:hypothetical protein